MFLGLHKCSRKKIASYSGFTIIELLITVSIAAILTAIAIPNFKSSMASNRLSSTANLFVSALNLARSEAVKRGQQVTVRREGTTSGQWEGGWSVFIDINGNGAFDDSTPGTVCATNTTTGSLNELTEDCKIRSFPPLSPSSVTLRSSGTFADFIGYTATGATTATPVTTDNFIICSLSGNSQNQKTLAISPTGRASVTDSTGTCP